VVTVISNIPEQELFGECWAKLKECDAFAASTGSRRECPLRWVTGRHTCYIRSLLPGW